MDKIEISQADLLQNISGYHLYVLDEPKHIAVVSQSLCDMSGYSKEELISQNDDKYLCLIHHSDRARYDSFLEKLSHTEQTLTLEYRIVCKNKSILYVKDTMVSKRTSNGVLIGVSTLCDITELKNENSNLQFLNETIPCGFIKYTCQKQPKVTYINNHMKELLRFPESCDGELDYLELYKDNIFLMIPMEERHKFALYLNRIYSAESPIAGEMTLLRCDGTRAYVFGWVTKCVNEHGDEEFQSVCMDVTERHQAKKATETQRYLKALSDVYDKIFEFDLSKNTVICLYSNNSPKYKWLENISMQLEDATERFIEEDAVEEDRGKIRAFFKDFCCKNLYESGVKPPQITYRARSSGGDVKLYSGIFIRIDNSVSLYCCRCVPDAHETDILRNENISLKKNMQELVMRFTDGVAAFEITDEFVTPLYSSNNVCEFFGFTKEEWLPLMKKSTPIKEFVARSDVAYEEFAELLRNGESEFTYFDLETETEKRIKAICSQKSSGGLLPRYIMLYNVEEPKSPESVDRPEERGVYIRTFGYFDVFVGEKPIAFRNKKTKELFALLVDRRGGYVSSQEAISFLWEDEPVSSVTLARYRKVALRLKNTLEEYGISGIIESVDGKRRIVMEKVNCDLYNYLSGREEYTHLFKGSYLTNYSWGENTLAELAGNISY